MTIHFTTIMVNIGLMAKTNNKVWYNVSELTFSSKKERVNCCVGLPYKSHLLLQITGFLSLLLTLMNPGTQMGSICSTKQLLSMTM